MLLAVYIPQDRTPPRKDHKSNPFSSSGKPNQLLYPYPKGPLPIVYISHAPNNVRNPLLSPLSFLPILTPKSNSPTVSHKIHNFKAIYTRSLKSSFPHIMSTKNHQIKAQMILNWILVLFCVTITPIKGEESRKLDATNGDVKCGSCEGGYTPSPPPPTIPPPPPPSPPPIIYPSPPPPTPKKPSSNYCPPPPSSAYLYMTGPPGNLYPVDENFSGASRCSHQSFSVFLVLLVGLFGMMAFC